MGGVCKRDGPPGALGDDPGLRFGAKQFILGDSILAPTPPRRAGRLNMRS